MFPHGSIYSPIKCTFIFQNLFFSQLVTSELYFVKVFGFSSKEIYLNILDILKKYDISLVLVLDKFLSIPNISLYGSIVACIELLES